MKKFVYFDNHLGHVYLTRSGDIQIGMVHRKERLDVEVIRARGLVGKPGNKQTPGDNAMFLLPLNKTYWMICCPPFTSLVFHQDYELTNNENLFKSQCIL